MTTASTRLPDEPPRADVLELVSLSNTLGTSWPDLAILAEGNVSAAAGPDRMLVKASGASLATCTAADLVEVSIAPLLRLVASKHTTDADVRRGLQQSKVDASARHPSVECLLHAVALTVGGARVVGHTHPTSVNSLLCSDQAEVLVYGALFPDQIVVLGRHQLLLPYVDPGLRLAQVAKLEIEAFRARYGVPPKVIFLRNHGMFVLGGSPREVLQITEMADKAAKVLLGTLSIGRPVFLPDASADRIDTRPDELLRREVLAQQVRRPER